MSCRPDVRPDMTVDVQIARCSCGECALVFTDELIRWERCVSCEHYRLLAWTSWQTPVLVLGEGSNVRA